LIDVLNAVPLVNDPSSDSTLAMLEQAGTRSEGRSYQCHRYKNIPGPNVRASYGADPNPRFGGTLIRNQNTDSCKAYCDASPGCNGYVVTSARDCWLKRMSLVGSERVTTGEWPTACAVAARSYQCTRYRNIEGGNSQAGWSHAEDRNVDANPRFGGTLIRNQNTDSCKAYCDASPGCNGYVVTSARDCWLKALNLLGSERVTTGEWPTACVLPERSYHCHKYRNIRGPNARASHGADPNPRFGGTLIRNQNVNTCKAYCDSSPGCNGYVVTSVRDCWLKQGAQLATGTVSTGEWPTGCVHSPSSGVGSSGVSTWAPAARWGQCNPSVSENCDVDKPCRIMGFTGKFLAWHTRDARGTSVTQCHCLLDSGNGFPCDGNVGSCECELGPITVAPVQVTDPPFSVKGGSKTFNMCGYEICPCTDDSNYGPPTIKHSAQCAGDCAGNPRCKGFFWNIDTSECWIDTVGGTDGTMNPAIIHGGSVCPPSESMCFLYPEHCPFPF